MQIAFNTYIKNDICWLINGISPDVLKEMFDAIHENRNCEVVRSGYYKRILRYTHDRESFYIKRYTVRNGLESVKSIFSLSKARREWNCAHKLLGSQLLTATPVAVGEKRRFGMLKDCYIISKAIPNSTTVKELLIAFRQSSVHALKKNTLLNNLISYVKMVHDHGIFHGELHTENMLTDVDNITLFYLLDLGRTVFKKKPSFSLRIQELSRLLYSMADTCTNNEITELIHRYSAQMSDSRDKENFTRAIFTRIYKIKRRLWHSRTRKCLKTNDVFKVTAHAKYTVNMRNEWDIGMLAALINKHTLSLGQFDTMIKTSPKIGITRIPVSHESIKSVYIKEYRYPSALKRCLYSFCCSPARRTWLAAHGLIALHFLTPKPIALFEEKRFARTKKSFVIMEDISHCLTCNKYVSENFSNPYDKIAARKKKRFISSLAMSFRRLHDSGVYHGDLKANNIMVRESQGILDFFYLDLDRVSFHEKITKKRLIKNLSQLNASLPGCITYTDRLRFYRTYTGMKNLTGENKRILKAIVEFSIRRKHVWNPKTQIPQISQTNNNLCSP